MAINTSGDTASPEVTLQVTNIAMKQGSTYVGITTLPPNLKNFEARDYDAIVFSWNTAHADSIKFTLKTTPSGCPASIQPKEKALTYITSSLS